MELLGVVGEYAAELRVYQLHFGVKPCRYPAEEAWALRPASLQTRTGTPAASPWLAP